MNNHQLVEDAKRLLRVIKGRSVSDLPNGNNAWDDDGHRNENPQIAAVAELHQPKFAWRRTMNPDVLALSFHVGNPLLTCEQCVSTWPCETYRALADIPAGRVKFVPDEHGDA